MATGKKLKRLTTTRMSDGNEIDRSVGHSNKEVGSECIKIQANRRRNQGSWRRTSRLHQTSCRWKNSSSLRNKPVTNIRATKISGGWDFEKGETNKTEHYQERGTKSIMILLPIEKGKSTVVVDTDEYEQKDTTTCYQTTRRTRS